MSDFFLNSMDITNFRSIRGQIHAPLDANVVLVHGENGAGKTSLLSAIELALTGRVHSLEKADQGYKKQLLHRSAHEGSVAVKTLLGETEQNFSATFNASGLESVSTLAPTMAIFFSERAFLPQSLLSQLLQIYQDAGKGVGSPLAQFVGSLLGLDRLDALEEGLKPLANVRNMRKIVEGWQAAENDRSRIDRLLSDQGRAQEIIQKELADTISGLAEICTNLGLSINVNEETLDAIEDALKDATDTDSLADLSNQQRKLAALRREIEDAQTAAENKTPVLPNNSTGAGEKYATWLATHSDRVVSFRTQVEALFPDLLLESAPDQAGRTALARLLAEQKLLSERVIQARASISRHALAHKERDVGLSQRSTIDEELDRLPSSAGSLGSALAEITSFIIDDTCPICDRDFVEVSELPLSKHVHNKVRHLSASAERLLTLGHTRGLVQAQLNGLDQEIETISVGILDEEVLANLDRRLAVVKELIIELEVFADALKEGAQLRTIDVETRRAVSEAQSRHMALTAARYTLSEFARSVGTEPIAEGETFASGVSRLDSLLVGKVDFLENRLYLRRLGIDHISMIRSALKRRNEHKIQIDADFLARQRADQALRRAQSLRDQGNLIRNTVDGVRSAIIRREFNDRLNRLWRDLFVRLAPGEPFIPTFRIPGEGTQKLQPKLITEYRDGGAVGGAPGAMLSAGNLNTAALTLFIALHMSVPKELPWLILDDPVQSMDDVHIAHFAALLRTLSKEHGRQIMIAVHDRQLFEYLKLELSPAFAGDSLLTLELARGPRRDSVCVSQRFSFQEETALVVAA